MVESQKTDAKKEENYLLGGDSDCLVAKFEHASRVSPDVRLRVGVKEDAIGANSHDT